MFYPWVGKIPWRREWQPAPVFLPGESHGQRGLAGYSLWGCRESDTTERLHFPSFPFLSSPSPCGPPRVGMNGIHAPTSPFKLPLVSCWDFPMTTPNQKPQDQAACPGWSPKTERRWSRGDQTNSGPGGPRADAHKGKQGGRSNESS